MLLAQNEADGVQRRQLFYGLGGFAQRQGEFTEMLTRAAVAALNITAWLKCSLAGSHRRRRS
jgi:hypothetical protein